MFYAYRYDHHDYVELAKIKLKTVKNILLFFNNKNVKIL